MLGVCAVQKFSTLGSTILFREEISHHGLPCKEVGFQAQNQRWQVNPH